MIHNNIFNTLYSVNLNNVLYKSKVNDQKMFLLIYVKKEYESFAYNAIPVYIKEFYKNSSEISLNLPNDKYFVVIQDAQGDAVYNGVLSNYKN